MVEDGVNLQVDPVGVGFRGFGLARDEETSALAPNVGGPLDAQLQRADWDQLMHRLAPSAGAGQVDQMEYQPARLMVEVAINEAGKNATRAPAGVVFSIKPGMFVFGSRIQAVSGG